MRPRKPLHVLRAVSILIVTSAAAPLLVVPASAQGRFQRVNENYYIVLPLDTTAKPAGRTRDPARFETFSTSCNCWFASTPSRRGRPTGRQLWPLPIKN